MSDPRSAFDASALASLKDPEKVVGLFDALMGGHAGVFRDLAQRRAIPGPTAVSAFCADSGPAVCCAFVG